MPEAARDMAAEQAAESAAKPAAESSAGGALSSLCSRYWQFLRHEFPLTATLAGEPSDDPTMFREAPADFERRATQSRAMLAELDAIDPVEVSGLPLQDRTTHRLLRRELSDLIDVHATQSHLRPWLLPVGPEFNTIYFANSSAVSDAASARVYADRVATLPGFLADVRVCLQLGLERGIRYPRVVLGPALANMHQATRGAADASAWFGPFKRSPAAAQPGVMREAERTRQDIEQRLVPALRALADFVELQMLPRARDTIACTDDPGGDAFYRFWTRHFTTEADATPEALHALGLAQVGRLNAEIAAVAVAAGYAHDVPGYRRFLREDPGFYAPSAEALREQLEATAKRIDGKIPSLIGRLPRMTYGVQSIPLAMSEHMPLGYAQPNPADGSSAGFFWITSLPAKAPSYLHLPIALHEAWPGHLMHLALMQEMAELPMFRRANFTKYTACLEGWAMYCESLGIDMGLYQTPHQHFGRLDMEMWRACRLVVDTGMHIKGWSREQAIGYMVEHLSMSSVGIEGEVDRYIAMPAQALAYMVGGLKFRELRRRCEQRLGERFNLRRYHDQLLAAGAVTLPLLDEAVDDWLVRA